MLSDTNYEKAVLSILYQHGLDGYAEVDFLTEECFSDDFNQILFGLLKDICDAGEKPDLTTILGKAQTRGVEAVIATDQNIRLIRALSQNPVLLENAGIYASKLKNIDAINRLSKLTSEIGQRLKKCTGNETINDILEMAEVPILEFGAQIFNHADGKPVMLAKDMEDHLANILDNPSKYSGIKTGFDAYDAAIGGGHRRGGVDVIGGRPKSGKSSMGLQTAVNVASRGIPVLIVDTEMMIDGQQNRFMANFSGVDVNTITSGEVRKNQNQLNRLVKSIRENKSIPIFHVNVSGWSFQKIISMMRNWVKREVGRDEDGKTNDCLIIYDYLKLTLSEDLGKNNAEYQILGNQITQLYNFMVKHDCACQAFVQLNRDEDVSQSDRIKWLCTSFTKFRKKSQDEMQDDLDAGLTEPYNRKLEVEIARFGAGTEFGDYINVRMRGEFARLEPGPTRNELLGRKRQTTIQPPNVLAGVEDTEPS